MEFTKKIKVPIGGSPNLTYGDFDFFGEFLGITPKTPTYIIIIIITLICKDFVILDNEKAGLDFVEVDGIYGDDSRQSGAFGGLIVGHSDVTPAEENETCTQKGFFGPKLWGSTINGTSFYNFDRPSCFAIGGCSQCTALTASFPIVATNLTFENSPNKVR